MDQGVKQNVKQFYRLAFIQKLVNSVMSMILIKMLFKHL
jgi:hypothetical protein